MSDPERDQFLRERLSVPVRATALDILKLIIAEGWTPHPYRSDVDGQAIYLCPISQGAWIIVANENATGRLVQTGWSTPELAALEALREARLLDSV